jgi:hypothetical protein
MFPGESRVSHLTCRPGSTNTKRVSAISLTTHNGEPCTQTSASSSCLSFQEIVIALLSTGHFTPHRATGANECITLHAQSQHPRRALSFHSLGFGKGCVGAQASRCQWASGMEDPSAGPRNEGHPRNSITGAGPPRDWCYTSRVCFLILEFLACFWVSDNFRHKGNFTRLDHRCPTSLPSTSLLQTWQISGELHKTSRGISMNLSISTFQSRFRGHS